MDDALIFPPDVVVAAPFSSPEGALVWLIHAANGDYGDFSRIVYGGFAGPWSTRPILTADLADTILTLAPDDGWLAALEDGSRWMWTMSTTLPTGAFAAEDGSPADGFAFVLADPVPLTIGPEWLTWLYRLHRGSEELARKRFDVTVKAERVEWARRLGGFERAVATTGRQLVEACNRWVSTVYVDAVNAGIPVVPDPEISDPDRARTNGVGIPRLGSPME